VIEDTIDLQALVEVDDPYPYFDVVRDLGPLVWSQTWNMWLVAGHEDAQALLKDPGLCRSFSDRKPIDTWETFNWLNNMAMLDLEAPDHTRLRRALTPAFKPGAIRSLQDQVHALSVEIVDRLVVKLNESEEVDLIAEFTTLLPVWVICSILGVPDEERHQIRIWSEQMVKMYEVHLTPEEILVGQMASQSLADFFGDLARLRRSTPQDDLISRLVDMEETFVDDRELIANIVLLLNGGTGALINGLGTGLTQMLQQPQIWQDFCLNHDTITTTTVEEFFRFDAPLQLFERVAIDDVDYRGHQVKRGEKVGLLLGAANRDPRKFLHPNDFNMRRSPNPHLSFSGGNHFCLGAPLARLEAQEALPVLARALPQLTLAAEPQRTPGLMVRGYERILVSRA
jgi:cytochrome P450